MNPDLSAAEQCYNVKFKSGRVNVDFNKYSIVQRVHRMGSGNSKILESETITTPTQRAQIILNKQLQKKVAEKSTYDQENEPIRHKVSRGETAFTISRLYNVSIRSLADWNGLDSNYTIREGQYLLIPLPRDQVAPEVATVKPGENSKTPSPPSSVEALPEPISTGNSETTTPEKLKTSDLMTSFAPNDTGQFSYPVNGKIIRDYVKNKTDGIDISAPEGTPIIAAEKGIVAAVTADTQEVPIIVLKHEGNLLTVYAGIGDIAVNEKEEVSRSQVLGKIRPGNPPFLHFEVRRGFESLDPMKFLN